MEKQLTKEEYLRAILDRTTYFFSQEELSEITNATVVIAGVGASGNMVIELLARWGISNFRLIDMDKFDLSNVNRQIFATQSTVNKWKTEAAAARIKEINPFANIEMIFNEKISKGNGEALIRGANLVINASDTRSSFLILHKFAQKYKVPLIERHRWQMTGVKIRVFDYRSPVQRGIDEPFPFKILNRFAARFIDATKKDFEKMSDEEIECLDKQTNYSGGSLGTTTSLVGALIVTEVIKLLTGRGKLICYPRELYLDMFNHAMRVGNKYSLNNLLFTIRNRKNEILKNIFKNNRN